MTDASNEVVAVIQADRDRANEWAFIEGRWSEYEGDFAADLAADFASHRIAHSDPRPVAEGLREALVEARETILELIHARDCQYEGTDEEAVGFIDAALATHSPAPMAGEVLKTASGEAVGIRDALRQEFRTASRGHGRAGTADWLDGPYMAMGDAADVYADLMLGRAASDVGEAFDLDGLKKLWRTGVETGRILQDTHPKAVQIVRDYQTVADAKYLSVKSRIDGGEEGLELTLAVALGLSHQAREIHSRLLAVHPSTQEG